MNTDKFKFYVHGESPEKYGKEIFVIRLELTICWNPPSESLIKIERYLRNEAGEIVFDKNQRNALRVTELYLVDSVYAKPNEDVTFCLRGPVVDVTDSGSNKEEFLEVEVINK